MTDKSNTDLGGPGPPQAGDEPASQEGSGGGDAAGADDPGGALRLDPERRRLKWASSKSVGRVSEIAVLAPVKRGCVPGERRTYEERLRESVGNIDARHAQGLPTELGAVPTIHFGRIIIIRPEQYLVYSNAAGVDYFGQPGIPGADAGYNIPLPFDEFDEDDVPFRRPPNKGDYRTWVLTAVEFDGDLKVYFRDIARLLGKAFDSIFQNCEDFPGTASFERFWLWIRRYQVTSQLFYAPYSQLSVARLKQLEAFKRRFDAFVAQVRAPDGGRAGSMDELFDAFLRENQQYARDFPTAGGLFRPGRRDEGI